MSSRNVSALFITVLFAAAATPVARASELSQARHFLTARATFEGRFDDGEREVRARKCGLQSQSGKYEAHLTYPAAPRVSLNSDFEGYVQVPFNCRVRTRWVAGCGGFQERTEDTQTSGYVQVQVSIGRNNKIAFQGDVKKLGGAYGNCGDAIVARLLALRGQTVIFR